jgi:predicted RecB family nuclease
MNVEQGGGGYRIDLLFEAISTGRKRLNEVKSSKTIREVHRIQAALYAALLVHMNIDEIAVSNKEIDEILTSSFIEEVQRRAQFTRQLLITDPATAASTYTPHEDCCYTCGNSACHFQHQTGAPMS